MDSEAVKIIWIGTALAAGVAAVITLFAAADNIPRWSVCALVITAGASFSFSWFAFGWCARSPVRFVLCHGLTWLCVALIGAVVWPREKSETPPPPKAESLDAQLSITCDNVALPLVYRDDLWTLNTVMRSGGLIKLMAPPGKEAPWPEEGARGFGYRCTVKNYGTQPAFEVTISLVVSKLELIRTGSAWTTGKPKETQTTTIRIPHPLGQQGNDPFSFYICSYDPDEALDVTLPPTALINSDDPKNKREVSVKVTSHSGNPFTVPPKQFNPHPHPEVAPAPTKSEPELPDIAASIVNPESIAIEYINNGGGVAKDIRSLVMIWNLDNLPADNMPLPKANVLTEDMYLHAKTYSMPFPIVADPINKPFVKKGDRLFGIYTATCADCKNNQGYWIYAVAGEGGWYAPWEKNRHPQPSDLRQKIRAVAADIDANLDFLVPDKAKRIPIKAQSF